MIEFELHVKTSRLNESLRGTTREATFARARAAKTQRTAARLKTPAWPHGPIILVHLVRVSKGTLDDDSVPAALKHVRDGIADKLKLDDASPLIRFTYGQDKGPPAVRVSITLVGGSHGTQQEDGGKAQHQEAVQVELASHRPANREDA